MSAQSKAIAETLAGLPDLIDYRVPDSLVTLTLKSLGPSIERARRSGPTELVMKYETTYRGEKKIATCRIEVHEGLTVDGCVDLFKIAIRRSAVAMVERAERKGRTGPAANRRTRGRS